MPLASAVWRTLLRKTVASASGRVFAKTLQALGKRDLKNLFTGLELAAQHHFPDVHQSPSTLGFHIIRCLARALHNSDYHSLADNGLADTPDLNSQRQQGFVGPLPQ